MSGTVQPHHKDTEGTWYRSTSTEQNSISAFPPQGTMKALKLTFLQMMNLGFRVDKYLTQGHTGGCKAVSKHHTALLLARIQDVPEGNSGQNKAN